MKREIKFRAWDKRGKKYLNNAQNIWMNNTCFGDLLASPNFEVEQFTGLKDYNGKEIYEGDILAWHSNIYRKQDWIGLVKYRGAGFVVQDDPKEFSTSTWLEVACSKDANIVEIVGNIHENPELLEVDE